MKKLSCLIGICMLCACAPKDGVQVALEYAGENRAELEKVLEYYSASKDSLKLEAARFLIENMPQHGYSWSEGMEMYRKKIAASNEWLGRGKLNEYWKEAKDYGKQERVLDLHTLTADFLIADIESAFRVWEDAPWHNEVDFDAFCNYILPYRLSDEPLAGNWRDSLYLHFHPVIEGEKDMKRAFVLLNNFVNKQMAQSKLDCPYVMDVLSLNKYGFGLCRDRSLLLGNALRAVGIPAMYDYIHSWTNYSKVGHTWIAHPDKGEIYTLLDKDTVLRKGNRIDASMFVPTYTPEAEYPFLIDSIKRVCKVWRSRYKWQWDADPKRLSSIPWKLSNPFTEDVSAQYALTDRVSVASDTKSDVCFLSIFKTGDNWQPAAWACREDGIFIFRNIGASIVYLPTQLKEGEYLPLGNPFILKPDGEKQLLEPDMLKKRTVRLYRKYPLFTRWTNQWGNMIGGRFEGSNRKDFKQAKVLGVIQSTPVFCNEMEVEEKEAFRYVRYLCPEACRTPMAEMEFWSDGQILKGEVTGEKATKLETCFDGNTMTYPGCKETKYWVGLDLSVPQKIEKIVYYPKNDDNFIRAGQVYELYYYNRKWISLGRQTASGAVLEYTEVPENALLLLKNHTEGSEERIFTYEDGKQVWW